jgi:hypothetical protein
VMLLTMVSASTRSSNVFGPLDGLAMAAADWSLVDHFLTVSPLS